MKNLLLCGLALCVLASLVGPVNAQGKKITRDEYTAQMADLVQREAEAKTQIASLKARIAELEGQANALDKAIDDLKSETLALVGASQRQVDAFSRRLDSITSKLAEYFSCRRFISTRICSFTLNITSLFARSAKAFKKSESASGFFPSISITTF